MMTLAFPTSDCRNVEIYSSNPKNAYLPKRNINNTFSMLPNSINYIKMCTKTYTATQQRVIVNAIGK